jgi:hypothetical protein
VDDTPAAGFEALLRRQQNLAREGIDRLVALDSSILRGVKALIPEAGDENPF